MTEEQKQFMEVMFNPGESVSVSSGKYSAHSIRQEDINGWIEMRTPEKHFKIHEDRIESICINPVDGWKRDENITEFRNFMFEFDDGPLEQQFKYVVDSGLPYSACVFSGNKSLHFALCMTQGYSEVIWRYINQWILNILSAADQQNKSPSRALRFPGNVRKGKKKQELLKLKGRVSQIQLDNWLVKHLDKKPKVEKPPIKNYGTIISEADIPPYIHDMLVALDSGTQPDRNVSWFKIAAFFAGR